MEAPNLSCEKCVELFRESRGEELPPCKTSKCPIGEDLAKDRFVNAYIKKFLTAKTLFKASGLPEVQLKAFDDLGLLEDAELHLHLEVLYRQGEQLREQQSQKENKGGFKF